MTNIAESVEREYQRVMEMTNREIAEITIRKRIIDMIKLETGIAITYGGLVSLLKLYIDSVDPQIAQMDFLQYLKSSYAVAAPTFALLVPVGLFLPEIVKGLYKTVFAIEKAGAKGIDYISNRLIKQQT